MANPRLEIDLGKVATNVRILSQFYKSKGIDICVVTKVVCANLEIAKILVESGIALLADSRIMNIKKMSFSGIKAQFILIGTPKLSETVEVVKYATISLNSEMEVIRRLSHFAVKMKKVHQVILMVELGDLREGILPENIEETVKQTILLKGVELVGLGTNLACFGGIQPTEEKMNELTNIAEKVERKFNLRLRFISGGNSANYEWVSTSSNIGRINQLRIGESIFLGCEPLQRKPILKLSRTAFTFIGELTEIKVKPSVSYGKKGENAFGHSPNLKDQGMMERGIAGFGLQDIAVSGLTPHLKIDILGEGSDHTLFNLKGHKLKVGDELKFNLNYEALLSAMTSPYVYKTYKFTK
jgi:predicted amino acid racemase